MNKLKKGMVALSIMTVGSLPAYAAFDYTALTTAIGDEVTAGLTFAAAALAVVLGAMVGLKLAKKFFNRAT